MLTEKTNYRIYYSLCGSEEDGEKIRPMLSMRIHLCNKLKSNSNQYAVNIESICCSNYEDCINDIVLKFNRFIKERHDEEVDAKEYFSNNEVLKSKFERLLTCNFISLRNISQDIIEHNYGR